MPECDKAKALAQVSLIATSVLSHQRTPECVAALAGRHIIILEDADDHGRRIAANSKAELAAVAASTRIVLALHLWKHLGLTGEPPRKWDIKKWLDECGDPAKLLDICREVPADGTGLIFIDMLRWGFEPVPDQEWPVYNRIPRRECVLFSGEGGAGKGILQLH